MPSIQDVSPIQAEEVNISTAALPSQNDYFNQSGIINTVDQPSTAIDNDFLKEVVRMQRPVTEKEIPELCKLIAAGNRPEVAIFAMQLLVPVI